MHELKIQIDAVLAELAPLSEEGAAGENCSGTLDTAKAVRLLDELVPMLDESSMQSLDMLPRIKETLSPAGEETDKLVNQIEDCDFELAIETTQRIKQHL